MRWLRIYRRGSFEDLRRHVRLKTHDVRSRAEILREVERAGREVPEHDPRFVRAFYRGEGKFLSFAELDFRNILVNLQKFYFRTRFWKEIYRRISRSVVRWGVIDDWLVFEIDVGKTMRNLSSLFMIPFDENILKREFHAFLRDLNSELFKTLKYNLRRQPKWSGVQIKRNWIKARYDTQKQKIHLLISPEAYPYIQGLPAGPGAVVYHPEVKGEKMYFISRDKKTGEYRGWHDAIPPWDQNFRMKFISVSYYKTLDYSTMFLFRFANKLFREREKQIRSHVKARKILDYIEQKTGEPVKFVSRRTEEELIDLGNVIFTRTKEKMPIYDILKKHRKWRPPEREVAKLSYFVDETLARELRWIQDIFKYGKKRF